MQMIEPIFRWLDGVDLQMCSPVRGG